MTWMPDGSYAPDPPAWAGEGYDAERSAVNFLIDLAGAQPDGAAAAIELAGTGTTSIDQLLADGALLDDPAGYDGDATYEDYALADAVASTSLEAEQQRQAEDAERSLIVPRGTDDRLAAAFARIEAGSYVPQGEYARNDDDPDDLSGRYAAHNCGISDYFGRCASADHAPGCSHNAGNPAGLAVHEVEEWRRAMNRNRGGRPEGLDADLYETGGGERRDAGYHLLATRLGLTRTPGDTVLARTSAGARAQAAQALQQGAPW